MQAVKATVHWDTKLFTEIPGRGNEDRLAIIISQQSGSNQLGAPIIPSSTGADTADSVFETLTDWRINNDIEAMSFDTTASNTGSRNGACVLLERKFGKRLLWLACMHHVLEIWLRAAWESKFGTSSAPFVRMFAKFKKDWKNINRTNFTPGILDENISNALDDVKEDIIKFCKEKLNTKYDRHDYKELLDLTLIFLGAYDGEITFRTPGAIHNARWMAKVLYALKIFMFTSQFEITEEEKYKLRDFCIFVVRFYVKPWMQCTIYVGFCQGHS